MRAARAIALAAAFTSSAASAGDHTCEREMARAARTHGVPLGMLYAVGLAETGRGDSLRPYALNIEGRAVYDIDKVEALRRVEAARKAGIKLIDIGCPITTTSCRTARRGHARPRATSTIASTAWACEGS
jgi:hypothetical protein